MSEKENTPNISRQKWPGFGFANREKDNYALKIFYFLSGFIKYRER